MTRPIIDPDSEASKVATQAAGEQMGAAIKRAIVTGLAKSVGRELGLLTMSDGPWLINDRGQVFDGAFIGEQVVRANLLPDHVTDWGNCDHPTDCDCSDARARRILHDLDPEHGWLIPSATAMSHTSELLVLAIDLGDRLRMWAADDDMTDYRRNEARDLAALVERTITTAIEQPHDEPTTEEGNTDATAVDPQV